MPSAVPEASTRDQQRGAGGGRLGATTSTGPRRDGREQSDPAGAGELFDAWGHDDRSALLVEQHVRQALKTADRVYVMERGRIVLSGTSEEVVGQLDRVEAAYFAKGS